MGLIHIVNIKINYVEKGSGQPFILIHGIFYDSSGYKKLIKILSDFYKIYAIDLPMHGKSEKPKEYLSILKFSKILKEFITKLKIKNPIICGHSGGTLIAIDYASKNKIKELVLIEPAGIKYYNSKAWLIFKIFILKTFFSILWNPLKTLNIIKVGLYNIIRNIFNKNYWILFEENFRKDYSNEMRKIKCPTKILWANFDEIIPFKFSKEFKKKIENSEIIKINGNHDWPIIRPKEVMRYVKGSSR